MPCLCSLLASRLEQITLWKEKLVSLLQCRAGRRLLTCRHVLAGGSSFDFMSCRTTWGPRSKGGCSKYPLSIFLSGEKKRQNLYFPPLLLSLLTFPQSYLILNSFFYYNLINNVVYNQSTINLLFFVHVFLSPFNSSCCIHHCPIRIIRKSNQPNP